MAAGDRATLNQLSQLMLRGFERRFNTPSTILATIANNVTMKDAETDQITNFIPMAYADNSAERDLSFPFGMNYNEKDDDRNEYNITFGMYDRDPSKIGGDSIYNQDFRTGMFGAALLQEQISYTIMDTIIKNDNVTDGAEVELKDLSSENNDAVMALDDLSLYRPHDLRMKLKLPMSSTIKAIVPFDIFPLLSARYQSRETDLGDQAFGGTIYDRVNNVRYVGDVASPVKFTIAVGASVAANDVFTLGNFSNHSAVKFIAASNTVIPKPGEVKLGANVAATKQNLIDYYTDQTQGEPTASSRYGVRIQYNFHDQSADAKPDPRNLHRQELRFVKAPEGASYDLIMYGSAGRIEPITSRGGEARTGAANIVSVSGVKGIALYVADGGMARYKVFDDMMYKSMPREKNMSISNHQIYGTHGTFISFGEAARFSTVDIDYSTALRTRLGRAE